MFLLTDGQINDADVLCFVLQDEGWLLGILELSGIKGVFPANFTKRI